MADATETPQKINPADWLNIRWIITLGVLLYLMTYQNLDVSMVLAFLGGAAFPVGNILKGEIQKKEY